MKGGWGNKFLQRQESFIFIFYVATKRSLAVAGTTPANLGSFIQHNFTTQVISADGSVMQSVVNSGQEVLLVFETDNGTFHAVAFDSVTSASSSGSSGGGIQVWDEQNNSCYTINESQVHSAYGLN